MRRWNRRGSYAIFTIPGSSTIPGSHVQSGGGSSGTAEGGLHQEQGWGVRREKGDLCSPAGRSLGSVHKRQMSKMGDLGRTEEFGGSVHRRYTNLLFHL